MLRNPTALAVLVATSLCATVGLRAETRPFTLTTAFDRVIERHPDLRVFEHTQAGLAAERDRADLRPPLVVAAGVDNALGSGAYRGLDAAELTLTLASVLERGGKRAARQALAVSRIDALAVRRESTRLDLLAEVARRYLDLVAAQAQSRIAAVDIEQRERTVAAAHRRANAGAAPASVPLAAQAALLRAQLEQERAQLADASAWRRLAVLWGDIEAGDAPTVADDALQLPAIPDFAQLRRLLESTPALSAFADEQRVREARLALAHTQRTPDLDWQVGVRHLQQDDDFALVASVALPLGSARRAEPDIRTAQAELAAIQIEREGGELALTATLAEAHGRYRAAVAEVERYRSDLLPALAQAEAAAERAYRAGALSYLDWAQLQSEGTAARKQQLAAALDGQRALIEIQRLTAEPFVLPATTTEALTP